MYAQRKHQQAKATKVLNMRRINDTIDEVIEELGSYADREPEITAAMQTMLAAKRLIIAYSRRVLDSSDV